jgi:hypothetical protein
VQALEYKSFLRFQVGKILDDLWANQVGDGGGQLDHLFGLADVIDPFAVDQQRAFRVLQQVAQWPVQALEYKSFLRFQVGKILDDLCGNQQRAFRAIEQCFDQQRLQLVAAQIVEDLAHLEA